MSYFFLYQPYYKDGRILGYEALIRETKNNLISIPYEYLSPKEIDNHYWIINAILNDIRNKKELQRVYISINIPARFISEEINFLKINFKGIDFSFISFEISEADEIINYNICNNNIDKLHKLGCTIALDDFGIDYSNFDRLSKINVDIVKFDISLIRGIAKTIRKSST